MSTRELDLENRGEREGRERGGGGRGDRDGEGEWAAHGASCGGTRLSARALSLATRGHSDQRRVGPHFQLLLSHSSVVVDVEQPQLHPLARPRVNSTNPRRRPRPSLLVHSRAAHSQPTADLVDPGGSRTGPGPCARRGRARRALGPSPPTTTLSALETTSSMLATGASRPVDSARGKEETGVGSAKLSRQRKRKRRRAAHRGSSRASATRRVLPTLLRGRQEMQHQHDVDLTGRSRVQRGNAAGAPS